MVYIQAQINSDGCPRALSGGEEENKFEESANTFTTLKTK